MAWTPLNAQAATATTSPPPAVQAAPAGTTRTAQPLDVLGVRSYLLVPDRCQVTSCPLVIISHPRAQDADRMVRSSGILTLSESLLKARFAVLISGDGGPTTWGSPDALTQVAQTQFEATGRFKWNSRTYAVGFSMGGLMALRSALPGSPYTVHGLALVDAWADLRGAWGTATSRRNEISAAYRLTGPPPTDLDPLHQAHLAPMLPLFVAGSPDDATVPLHSNSERLYALAQPELSEFVTLSGPHLGANRFSQDMARRITSFFQRLELGTTARKH
ncbi:alpha/beta hydrolase [Deinococcus deserti]